MLHSIFLINLTLLSGFVIFTYTHPTNGPTLQVIAVGLSTGVTFLQFCGIVLYAIIAPRCSCQRKLSERDKYSNIVEPVADITESTGYRDSIFDEDTQPLLTNDSNAKYKQLEWAYTLTYNMYVLHLKFMTTHYYTHEWT